MSILVKSVPLVLKIVKEMNIIISFLRELKL